MRAKVVTVVVILIIVLELLPHAELNISFNDVLNVVLNICAERRVDPCVECRLVRHAERSAERPVK